MSFSLPRYFTIILNPSSGAKTSTTFLNETLLPLLKSWNEETDEPEQRVAWEVLTSESEGDGVRLGGLIRAQADKWKENVVVAVVLGGDGTSHELIEGFYPTPSPEITSTTPSSTVPNQIRLEIIPLPLGTANALYNTLHPPSTTLSLPSVLPSFLLPTFAPDPQTTWSLRSLSSFLTTSHTSTPLPLPLTTTTLYGAPDADDSPTPTEVLKTHIVLSTAMHANLLERSEQHRAEHPGVERFKIAAEDVLPMKFPGTLTLLPASQSESTTTVERYDPETKTFQRVEEEELVLAGPFAYVLSSTAASRLEAEFVVSPLLVRLPPGSEGGGTMDLVVLRPERSQEVKKDGEVEGGKKWEEVVRGVMGGAYHDGQHVGELLSDPVVPGLGGRGVTEVYRVGGFIWEPPTDSPSSSASHVVCADGAIHRIPAGGRAIVRVSAPEDGEVKVWQ